MNTNEVLQSRYNLPQRKTADCYFSIAFGCFLRNTRIFSEDDVIL